MYPPMPFYGVGGTISFPEFQLSPINKWSVVGAVLSAVAARGGKEKAFTIYKFTIHSQIDAS
jgi:hypothetical protein